jgi:hypothetical protein
LSDAESVQEAGGYETEGGFATAQSDSDLSEADGTGELSDTAVDEGTAGGARGTDKSPGKNKLTKLDKLIKGVDQFVFKGYPKRNIPRKNYKE